MLLRVLSEYDTSGPLILSIDPCQEVTILKVAQLIARNFKLCGEIRLDTSVKDGAVKRTLDNSKMKSLFPNFEFTPLDSGIERTVKWFKENDDSIKIQRHSLV